MAPRCASPNPSARKPDGSVRHHSCDRSHLTAPDALQNGRSWSRIGIDPNGGHMPKALPSSISVNRSPPRSPFRQVRGKRCSDQGKRAVKGLQRPQTRTHDRLQSKPPSPFVQRGGRGQTGPAQNAARPLPSLDGTSGGHWRLNPQDHMAKAPARTRHRRPTASAPSRMTRPRNRRTAPVPRYPTEARPAAAG